MPRAVWAASVFIEKRTYPKDMVIWINLFFQLGKHWPSFPCETVFSSVNKHRDKAGIAWNRQEKLQWILKICSSRFGSSRSSEAGVWLPISQGNKQTCQTRNPLTLWNGFVNVELHILDDPVLRCALSSGTNVMFCLHVLSPQHCFVTTWTPKGSLAARFVTCFTATL